MSLDDFFGKKFSEVRAVPTSEEEFRAAYAGVTIGHPPAPEPEPFKYSEGKILDDLRAYLAGTYGQHYVGKNSIQANDLVLAGDKAEARGFWKWNAIKYLLRYGKKGGHNKADLLKALHYTILVMYLDHEQDNGEGE